jgi:hypothetical protein
MVNPIKLGFTFGSLAAILHIGWALVVAAGFGQTLVDFALRIHFFTPNTEVEPFEIGRALVLIAVTFSAAFIVAALGGAIWNSFNRMR